MKMTIFLTAARTTNKGAQRFAKGSTTPALAGGQTSSGLELGLRHSF